MRSKGLFSDAHDNNKLFRTKLITCSSLGQRLTFTTTDWRDDSKQGTRASDDTLSITASGVRVGWVLLMMPTAHTAQH